MPEYKNEFGRHKEGRSYLFFGSRFTPTGGHSSTPFLCVAKDVCVDIFGMWFLGSKRVFDLIKLKLHISTRTNRKLISHNTIPLYQLFSMFIALCSIKLQKAQNKSTCQERQQATKYSTQKLSKWNCIWTI